MKENLNQKKTVRETSVAADDGQPIQNNNIIITDLSENINKEFLSFISLNQLLDTSFAPKLPVIKGLLHCGTYIFVGPPKIGKSFMMAQIAYHVATGKKLWGCPVRKGTVLYLALEDDYSRIQQRISKMFGGEGTDDLLLAIQSPTLHEGLDVSLEAYLKEHSEVILIIIDTLQKIRECQGDKFSYGTDYEVITRLKKITDAHNICMLIVHHTRKMDASDSFEMISGTNGIFGAADGAFVLQKKSRTDTVATLEITGRDQPDEKLELQFDTERCIWNMNKRIQDFPAKMPDLRLEHISNIVNQGEWEGTPTELYNMISADYKSVNAMSRYLNSHSIDLLSDHNIVYKQQKNHEGRWIYLKYEDPKSNNDNIGDDM